MRPFAARILTMARLYCWILLVAANVALAAMAAVLWFAPESVPAQLLRQHSGPDAPLIRFR